MAEKKAPEKPPAKTRKAAKASESFSDEEKAAMQERAQELKSGARRGARREKPDGESDVLAKIAEMEAADRSIAERLHELIKATAPELAPRTWYGMPAYAKDGKVVCFFQAAKKFKTRYATLGFSDEARLDDGAMWPSAFAVTELSPDVEGSIRALVKKAVG